MTQYDCDYVLGYDLEIQKAIQTNHDKKVAQIPELLSPWTGW